VLPLSEGDRAALTIAGLGVLVGSMGLVVRQVDLPAVVVVWGRLVFAIPPLAVFVAFRGDGSWTWRPGRKLVVSSLVLAVHWTALVAALQRAPIGTVLLITYLAPVGIAALAPRVLGEHVTARMAVALGLGVAGVALIAIPSIGGSNADGVALAVLTGAVYVVLALLNKQLTVDFGGAELALWQALVAGAVVSPLAATADWGAPTVSWLWLPVLGVVYTAGFFGAYLTALRNVDASRAVILLYLEPASAVVFGWLLLHERPTAWTCLGGLAIIAGGLLVVRTPTPDPVGVTVAEAT
jgi:drug/metabolite transporter (DMT)-like permease